jgi:hypothetical protein
VVSEVFPNEIFPRWLLYDQQKHCGLYEFPKNQFVRNLCNCQNIHWGEQKE